MRWLYVEQVCWGKKNIKTHTHTFIRTLLMCNLRFITGSSQIHTDSTYRPDGGGGYRSTWAMCQRAVRLLEGRGRGETTREEEGSKTCEGNLNLLGAIRLSGSVYYIRRNIKLYIVLDEILTLF